MKRSSELLIFRADEVDNRTDIQLDAFKSLISMGRREVLTPLTFLFCVCIPLLRWQFSRSAGEPKIPPSITRIATISSNVL